VHGLVFAALRAFSETKLAPDALTRAWGDVAHDPTLAYDDGVFERQLTRVREAVGTPPDAFERELGAFTAQTVFVDLFPGYYAENAGTVDFLLGLEEQIHEVVRATIPGARPPHLHIQRLGRLGVLVSYTSDRGLCRLLEGLVLGTAAFYREQVAIEEIQCMRLGDAACVFTVLQAD